MGLDFDSLAPKDGRGVSHMAKQRLEQLLSERAIRSFEALNLYEPLPYQDAYHACTAKECIIQKGNQTGGEQPHTEPVLTPVGWSTIGELQIGDEVIGGDGKACRVVGITEFGVSPTYKFTFTDGTTTEAGINHNWTCCLGARPKTSHVDEEAWNVVKTDEILAYLRKNGPWFSDGRNSNGRYRIAMPSVEPGFKYLASIEFIGNKQSRCIQVDNASHTYVTRDFVVTHNSLAGFVEVARAVTAQDPYDKYPKENGIAICLGYGEKHIGRVIYRYLFRAGAFNIIRDRDSGEWRTYRPWAPDREWNGKFGDADRKGEAKPAPPLIPKRYIKSIAFEKKSEHIFSYVQLNTDWELIALNSAGDPSQAQGFQANLYHIDEDVATGGWHEEAIGRTMTREGLIRWTALPHQKTSEILEMIQRAEEEDKEENPRTVCLRATMYDNPYLPEQTIKENERIWKSAGEDVYRKRALGELTLDRVNVYPGFSKYSHNAVRHVTDEEREEERNGIELRHEVQRLLTENGGEPLEGWTRYMIGDPGHTVFALGYFCVPPPELGNFKILYDEDYIRNATATIFGEHAERKAANRCFEDFIIDAHGARLRELASGVLPRYQYEKELEKRGIRCEKRGSRFADGSDDIAGRELAMREWLMIQPSGYPVFLVNIERCPNFVREIQNFKKKTIKQAGRDVTTDDANRRGACHMIEVVEYGAAHGLPYVKPKRLSRVQTTSVDWILEGRRMRQEYRDGNTAKDDHFTLGPTGVKS